MSKLYQIKQPAVFYGNYVKGSIWHIIRCLSDNTGNRFIAYNDCNDVLLQAHSIEGMLLAINYYEETGVI